ncbi:MAG: carboxypeptidase regulatory-like domain-containing protein, partial [Planctomycetes bacterium]|nr:carboxypeptidase regulatory-like domain-containing protein [Planctomycetota bacterium]
SLDRTVVPAPNRDDAELPRITGRLVDADGLPRPGLQLTVSTWRFGGPAEVVEGTPDANATRHELTTDDDGRFAFRLAGTRTGNFSLPADDLVFADRARVQGNGKDQDLGDLLVVGAASIAGVVQDEGGRPLAGVTVAAELGPLGFDSVSMMTTGEDGAFSLGKLGPGTWTLRATSAQFLPSVSQHEIEAAQRVEGLVVTMSPGAVISGRVVDDRGVGVAGMKVVSQRKERSGDVEVVRFTGEEAAVTDANGNFRLAGLEGEHATLKASGEGHTTVVESGVETGKSGVELRVQRLASVTGVLVTADGAPIVGSRVRAYTDRTADTARDLVGGLADIELAGDRDTRATTDEQGRFEIPGVWPGVVRVEAKGKGHLPAEQRGLTVLPAQRVDGLRLVARAGTIARIEVVDERGAPIAGAKVEVERAPRQQAPGMRIERRIEGDGPDEAIFHASAKLGAGETGDDGVAVVAGLPAADAVVKAGHARFAPTVPTPLRLPGTGTVTTTLTMFEPGFVEAKVTRADGGAAVGTPVQLLAPGAMPDDVIESGKAGADGVVRFGPLRAGDYEVVLARSPQVRRAGGMMMVIGGEDERIRSSAQTVAVVAGETAKVALEMPIMTRLTGRVLGTDGPAVGVVIEIERIGDEDEVVGFAGRQERSDSNGDFAFDEVEPGKYEVRYGKPDQVVKAKLELDVPPNTPTLHRDLLLRTGSLRVMVLSKDDAEPVVDADVMLQRAPALGAPEQRRPRNIMMVSVTADDGGSESATTMMFGTPRVTTGEDGVATFEDVPVGTYMLTIESERFAPFEKDDVVIVERQRTDVGTVEVALAGQVRGRVTDTTGKPVMAMVQCRPVGSDDWDMTEMSMQGTYRLRGLRPGRYEVRARALGPQAGEPSQPVQVEVVAGKTRVADLTVKP